METAKTIARSLWTETADFMIGALPMLAMVGGLLAVVILPLWWVARSLGVC